jgi:ribosomal protein L28
MDNSLTTKSTRTKNQMAGSEHKKTQEIMPSACPQNVYWESENAETDLHISTSIMTILAMDGRRRWLDIKKLVCTLLSESVTVPIWDHFIPSNSSSLLDRHPMGGIGLCL